MVPRVDQHQHHLRCGWIHRFLGHDLDPQNRKCWTFKITPPGNSDAHESFGNTTLMHDLLRTFRALEGEGSIQFFKLNLCLAIRQITFSVHKIRVLRLETFHSLSQDSVASAWHRTLSLVLRNLHHGLKRTPPLPLIPLDFNYS